MDFGGKLNQIKKNVERDQQRRQRFQTDAARYTTILHAARRQLKVTISEYVMCDIIHKLSGNRGAVAGWCYASREYLGKQLGISRQGATKIIERMISRGLIEADEETNYLRTTKEWYYAVEAEKKKLFSN